MVSGGPESSPVPQATSTKTTVTTSTSTNTAAPSKKVNIGAIVGGAVGGIAVLVAICGLIVFIIIRRRRASAPNVPVTNNAYTYTSPQNLMSGLDNYTPPVPSTMTSGRLYVSPACYQLIIDIPTHPDHRLGTEPK